MIPVLLSLMLAPLGQIAPLHGTFKERAEASLKIAEMTELSMPGFWLMAKSSDPWTQEIGVTELRIRESARKAGVPRMIPDSASLLVPYKK